MAKVTKKQVWSNIDAFGLLNGISVWDEQYKNLKYVRKPFDTTHDIRKKIYNLHDNKVDTTYQGIVNGLSIEFDYEPYNVYDKHIFLLSYEPNVYNSINEQDVFVYYKLQNSDDWNELTPQTWNVSASGFMVWQKSHYNNLSTKNFIYSNILQIFSDLPDLTEIKVKYKIYIDTEDGKKLVDFTDVNSINEDRLTYRKKTFNNINDSIQVYNLTNIPSGIYSQYYKNGIPTDFTYKLKNYISSKFKHKWGEFNDSSCIWDINKYYGSGHLPSYYDAYDPIDSGYLGGIESSSTCLYPYEIIETDNQVFNLKMYPGKFYISGIPFYMFENPRVSNLVFFNGSCNIPSGLSRTMHTILSPSDFYNSTQDEYLNGHVYEDYIYPTGINQIKINDILRRRPYLNNNNSELDISLASGEYSIDFSAGKIYASGINNGVLIWDNSLINSGFIVPFNVNPSLYSNINSSFFIYLNI